MNKTIIFIDGSNFYRGMESFLIENKTGISLKDYKFDFKSFIKAIGGDELIETRYYNVKLLRFENPERFKRQRNFFHELEKIPDFKVIKGKQVKRDEKIKKCIFCSYQIKPPDIICPNCNKIQPRYYVTEKGVDVKIAIDMLLYAMQKKYDKAILVSGDRDFVPVVDTIKNEYKRHITNAYFPQPKGPTAIQKACTDYIALTYGAYIKQFLIQKTFVKTEKCEKSI